LVQPSTFELDGVIRGWTPENLAYGGSAGSPQGMLVFDIELIKIES
jgi:FKBP-type peptidyl-prolyl cis-trans isomerase